MPVSKLKNAEEEELPKRRMLEAPEDESVRAREQEHAGSKWLGQGAGVEYIYTPGTEIETTRCYEWQQSDLFTKTTRYNNKISSSRRGFSRYS